MHFTNRKNAPFLFSTRTGTRPFERSLYEFLKEELGSVQVTKQFANGRVRADLVVGDKVIVELKVDLDTTVKYQRLIGQLEEYREWEGDIAIVLFGKTDPNLRKKLDEQVANKSGLFVFDQQAQGCSEIASPAIIHRRALRRGLRLSEFV